ncbi:MAG TPA: rhodanese-like domain-containing protein [Bacteroidales bacterium]|nr:rhodanese-like domain-containing protein [Bacteroidales bacterium]
MRVIDGNSLLQLIGADNIHVIDIRQADAYNGWSLMGEKRGGHIRSARCMPFRWFSYFDWIEIVKNKNISPENKLVIYGYSNEEIDKAAVQFSKAGFKDVIVYYNFINEWSENTLFPIDILPGFRNLVPPQWVNDLITGNMPAHFANNKYVIIHSHYRNRNAYLSGHIPGAVDMDTLDIESPETWNRRSPDELEKALTSHGITSDTTVILYGKFMFPDNRDPFPGSAAGDIGAMRCAFIMLYSGVRDVRILNGGFRSWEDAGLPVSKDDEPKIKRKSFGDLIPSRPCLAVDTPEAKEILGSADSNLVCVRSFSEYTGEVSGYNYIEKKGRIPGAIFADCGSDAYHMENYRNPDHTTREFPEIEKIWKANGISRDKRLAFYCGTGWRGSEAFINAWLMGYPRIAVYDGGWFEWSNDPDNPYESGEPLKQTIYSL